MAPSRKTGNANKQSPTANKIVAKKDEEDAKTKQKKRKLGDMLGSQWSNKELQQFYEAYRKYGTNWKKVAAAVRSRSVEMVEALYSMNRAYLSLPEGTASVAGLIAMVTDHYCVMERSDSEQESNEGRDQEAPQKAQKRSRRKFRNSKFKDMDHNLPDHSPSRFVGSTSDCLSLLKANLPGSEPRVVGKRTPRVPVVHTSDKDFWDKNFSASPGRKFKMNADDHVAHEIALALTKASQKDKSPRISQSNRASKRKIGNVSSPAKSDDRMHFIEETSAQLQGSARDEIDHQGSMGSIDVDNLRSGSTLRDREGFGTLDIQKKGLRSNGKKFIAETGNDHLDDMKEACSGTEEQNSSAFSKNRGFENPKQLISKGQKQRNKKILFDEDESAAFEALNTLADLSLTMPEPFLDNDNRGADINTSSAKSKGNNSFGGDEDTTIKFISSDRGGNVGTIPDSEDKTGIRKRKPKSLPFCMENLKMEPHLYHTGNFPNSEDVEHANKSLSKGHHKEGEHVNASTLNVSRESEGDFSSKNRNWRKRDLPKSVNLKDTNYSVQVESGRPTDGILNLKAKLANCLSWRKARRWCTFEWFYSAIDYPWFARREFVEYLDHVGLGHIPRLTRVEWGVIRSSLGKPRRFSQQFLKEEKEKLNQYRESVRNHYTELRLGAREGLPTDLARPLSVGQRVIAIHPKTREVHDGSVLTVDRSRCHVQFDKPDLGVEFVMDIDCMPLNPLENMPASLAINKLSENHNGVKLNGLTSHHSASLHPNGNIDKPDDPLLRPWSDSLVDNSKKTVKDNIPSSNVQAKARSSGPISGQEAADQPSFLAQSKEADVKALYEMTCALDKKEAIVSEFKRMNDEVEENKRLDSLFEVPESFSKRYASVLVQLDEVNDQASILSFMIHKLLLSF
uniref:SANT domain-containing protein n=1 Tax=Kalanchoe fedtschenkoi TaxID=63787 RepID=A0A7N0UKF7_KALFE